MFDKIKSTAKDAKLSASLEAAYLNHKKNGFPHPPEVEEHIDIMRGLREETPKLRGRVGDMDSALRHLAEYEEKFSDDLLSYIEIPMQNPQITSIYKTYAEGKRQTAQKRYKMQSMFDQIKEEWKPFESENLVDIKAKQDKANRAISDLTYFQKNNKVAKASEVQMLYDMLSVELIDLIHILRVRKENTVPGFFMRLATAEAEFFRESAAIAEAVFEQLRNIGPVSVVPNTFGSMTGVDPNNYQPPPIIPQGQGPPPGRPGQGGPQCRGLYDFRAESPQELSFRAGDVMNLLNGNGDWWTVELGGRSGLIPANYVQRI